MTSVSVLPSVGPSPESVEEAAKDHDFILRISRSCPLRRSVSAQTFGSVDLDAATWTVPASRMKAKHEHRVPLSAQCLEVLDAASELRTSDLVFPSARDTPIGTSTMGKLMREIGLDAVPHHGFRSSFRYALDAARGQPRTLNRVHRDRKRQDGSNSPSAGANIPLSSCTRLSKCRGSVPGDALNL